MKKLLIIICVTILMVFVAVGCERNHPSREISSQNIHMTICYDDSKPRKQTLMERNAIISLSFIVNVDECTFGR